MKVIIAIDSFKGSLSSEELSVAVEKGIGKVYIDAEIDRIPIADGGEGTVEALVEGTGGKIIEKVVKGPLLSPVKASYGILGDQKTAVIEMATASGLPLVPVEKRNPQKTTTYGTGELIKDAVSRGCREFIVGIGGSATNDAGLGMLQALGFKFMDKDGNELAYGGEQLDKVASVDSSNSLPELSECSFLIACDVDNPLYGKNGAAHVYSRQKGADEEMVLELDKKLKYFGDFIRENLGKDVSSVPGAGAAGGLGGGFLAFLNSELKSGIDIVLEAVKLEERIAGADFVVTGEGRIDSQSVMGKAPTGVSKICAKNGVPVIALAGCVSDDAGATHDHGITALFSTINYPISLVKAMEKDVATSFVEKNSEEIFRLIKICEEKYSK